MNLLTDSWGLHVLSIMFYAPIIFKTISKNGALLATVITGAVNVGTTFVSVGKCSTACTLLYLPDAHMNACVVANATRHVAGS